MSSLLKLPKLRQSLRLWQGLLLKLETGEFSIKAAQAKAEFEALTRAIVKARDR